MKCTYLCAECSIIQIGQRDGVKSCLAPRTPIDWGECTMNQGDRPAIEQENCHFKIRWAGLHPETPSNGKARMQLPQAGNNLPEKTERDLCWLWFPSSFVKYLSHKSAWRPDFWLYAFLCSFTSVALRHTKGGREVSKLKTLEPMAQIFAVTWRERSSNQQNQQQ